MRIVAVSAHLDDVALSASAALAGNDTTVMTMFTALPAEGMPVTWWDRLTGATDSRQRQTERLAEDAAAMRLLGAESVHLDQHEALYRKGDPDLDGVASRIARVIEAADEVWLPAAIGGHGDHMLAREAGWRAAQVAGRPEVVLYADYPYVIAYGWPSWVTGTPADGYLDAAYWLADQLTSAGLDAHALTPIVTRLNPQQRATKAQVIAAYASQASALRLAPHDLARDPAKLDFELAWRAPTAAARLAR